MAKSSFLVGDAGEGGFGGFLFLGHDFVGRVLGHEDEDVAGADEFGVFEFLFVLVVEFFDVVVGHFGLVTDLGFHPLLLLHHFFDGVAEGGLGLAGFGHFGLEDFFAGELGFDAGDFGVDFGVGDVDGGGFAGDEFVDDELVEDLAVAGHFLVGGEVVGADAGGADGVTEGLLQVGAGDFFAFDNGDGVGQRGVFGRGGGFIVLGHGSETESGGESQKAAEAAEVGFHKSVEDGTVGGGRPAVFQGFDGSKAARVAAWRAANMRGKTKWRANQSPTGPPRNHGRRNSTRSVSTAPSGCGSKMWWCRQWANGQWTPVSTRRPGGATVSQRPVQRRVKGP